MNGGKLADYVVSHAGERAFARSFQLLEEGGRLAFYGASSGYHFSFMGKTGSASPQDMLARANLRGGESVLLYYGPGTHDLADEMGLEMIEAARLFKARMVIVTTSDGQREFLQSLGLEDAVEGIVSIEGLQRRNADFDWPDTTTIDTAGARVDIERFSGGLFIRSPRLFRAVWAMQRTVRRAFFRSGTCARSAGRADPQNGAMARRTRSQMGS